MAGFLKFIAVAIFVGCSFSLVCAGNPYDMSGHFWPSRDTAKESDGARYFPPRLLYIPYEKKVVLCCLVVIILFCRWELLLELLPLMS